MEYYIKMLNLLYLFSICITLSICEPLPPLSGQNKPVILSPGWSSSNGNLISKQGKNSNIIKNTPRTLVIQIRSDSAMPSLILKQRVPHHHKHIINHHNHLASTRVARPIKMAISPHFVIKSGAPLSAKNLIRKPKPTTKTNNNKNNNSSVKPPDDYIYKKPFTSSLTHHHHHPHHHHTPIDNTIHLAHPHFEPIHAVPAPNLAFNHINDEETHSYQVTEDHTNDQTLHDPFSGQHKYFAPDPDPSLPASKIQPTFDPFSTPSNGKPLPPDVQSNYLSSSGINTETPLQPLIQFLTPIINPSYFDPAKLQQLYASKAASFSREPLSVHNPTYLVTQSNNLFNQHQQQLFNPNPHYLNTNFLTQDQIHEVASTGQISEANKNQDSQTNSNSLSQNSPTFAALIAASSNVNPLTNNEINQHNPEGGFIISNYYDDSQNVPQSHQQQVHYIAQEPHHHHHHHQNNDRTIPQAHLDLHNQLIVQNAQQYAYDDQIQSQTETSTDAHEEHQKLLEQHLGSTPLRIFVPDDSEYHGDSNQILQKRSDDYSGETTKKMDNEYTDDYYSMEESKETNKF